MMKERRDSVLTLKYIFLSIGYAFRKVHSAGKKIIPFCKGQRNANKTSTGKKYLSFTHFSAKKRTFKSALTGR